MSPAASSQEIKTKGTAIHKLKFLKFWFPVILYSGIIFYISGMPNLKIPIDVINIDKVIHAFEYAFLGFLFYRALEATAGLPLKQVFIYTVLFCLLYGLSDEYHQSFVVGRTCTLSDALTDTLGGLLGGLVFLRRQVFLKFIKNN